MSLRLLCASQRPTLYLVLGESAPLKGSITFSTISCASYRTLMRALPYRTISPVYWRRRAYIVAQLVILTNFPPFTLLIPIYHVNSDLPCVPC